MRKAIAPFFPKKRSLLKLGWFGRSDRYYKIIDETDNCRKEEKASSKLLTGDLILM
ncbi:MAG: hypothetical protein F6K54_26640 [Okeania sp. SIO3B5]|uniref:hypothetical protein n=1 Tax=Okeania sp. SIO3B5 TaxID=2607811 RepID=UPI0013FED3C0|nr:hypothetical protein [Okeania sp. SIO3B5]NEO56346.1 hypothetical protein [Okeania sp. SIO3B5]